MFILRSQSPLTCSDSETMNPFRRFGRTPWTGIGPSRGLCLPTQDKKEKRGRNIDAFERDSNRRSVFDRS
jgi:hypothetical protein